jgi:hypothetical protein
MPVDRASRDENELCRAYDLVLSLAPTLKESEYKILLELTKRFAVNPLRSDHASSFPFYLGL